MNCLNCYMSRLNSCSLNPDCKRVEGARTPGKKETRHPKSPMPRQPLKSPGVFVRGCVRALVFACVRARDRVRAYVFARASSVYDSCFSDRRLCCSDSGFPTQSPNDQTFLFLRSWLPSHVRSFSRFRIEPFRFTARDVLIGAFVIRIRAASGQTRLTK